MAAPPTAKSLGDPMDPTDLVDYEIALASLLQAGEGFATVSLALLPESAALGFQIAEGVGRETVYDPGTKTVRLWASVAPADYGRTEWNGAGTTVAMEVTAVTNSTPSRRYQRTCTIPVAHQ